MTMAWLDTPPPAAHEMVSMDENPIVWFRDTGQTRAQAFVHALYMEGGLEGWDWVDLRARRTWYRWNARAALAQIERDWRAFSCGEPWAPPKTFFDFLDANSGFTPWLECSRDDPRAVRFWVVSVPAAGGRR